jgi:hypothetical protein
MNASICSKVKQRMNGSSNWTSIQLESWQRVRAKGKWNYILLRGVLLRGSILSIILLAGVLMTRPTGFLLVVMTFGLAGIGYSLGGITGAVQWNRNENMYELSRKDIREAE